MKELFLPYDLSLALKEIGFDEPCLAWLYTDIKDNSPKLLDEEDFLPYKLKPYQRLTTNDEINKTPYGNRITASPLYDQVIDWFIEKYNIFIEVLVFDIGFLEKGKFCFQWRIYDNSEEWFTNTTEYKSPKEALQAGIKKVIELVKQKL
jgi:hypothetical protein